ncbi:hypothetical protein P5V15_015152 [Pogonomyrmex californicus]
MSASGYWCALILLTFTQDSLASHHEKLFEKPKEYLRHQQNHRSTAFADRKLDPTEFRAAEVRPTIIHPSAEIARSEAATATATENRPIIARDHPGINLFRSTEIHSARYESRSRANNRPEEIRSTPENLAGIAKMRPMENRRAVAIRSAEIFPTSARYSTEVAHGSEKVRASSAELRTEVADERTVRIRSAEMRSQAEDRHPAEEVSPMTGTRPMEILWTEIEQADTSSIERSQIRHGRSRSHFARQKIEDSARDGSKDAANRIKTVREDHENHFKIRQVEKVSDFPEETVSPRRNHSWLLERNFSKDNSINSQPLDRIENNVSEGLESLLKLYQGKKGSVIEESTAVSLTRNLSWLIGQNNSKGNNTPGNSRSADQIKSETDLQDAFKAHQPENHGILRSSPDSLKSSYKEDPLSKLRRVMSLNRTAVQPAAATERNTTETFSIDAAEDASESARDLEEEASGLDYTSYEEPSNVSLSDQSARKRPQAAQVDIVTRFLRIIENQHTLGENCTAGTDLNLGEGVVDQYAQERFRLEAEFAVNRANMLTRLWKYAPEVMLSSEYLLHASVLSMVEFDEDIFAAGNCYDKLQYRGRWLYCPFAHRLPNQDGVLVKDLAIQYKYLSNSSEWFYIARKNAERVIASYEQFSRVKQVDNKTSADVRECPQVKLQQHTPVAHFIFYNILLANERCRLMRYGSRNNRNCCGTACLIYRTFKQYSMIYRLGFVFVHQTSTACFKAIFSRFISIFSVLSRLMQVCFAPHWVFIFLDPSFQIARSTRLRLPVNYDASRKRSVIRQIQSNFNDFTFSYTLCTIVFLIHRRNVIHLLYLELSKANVYTRIKSTKNRFHRR